MSFLAPIVSFLVANAAPIAAATGAVGLGYNVVAGEQAKRRQQNEMEDARIRQQRELERQRRVAEQNYKTSLRNWKDVNQQIDEQINYLTQLAESPGEMSPEFGALKGELEESAKATTGRLQDVLRRSGLKGGRQIKVQQDVTEEVQGRLAEALSYISDQARKQIHEANLSRPLRPLRQQVTQAPIQYQPFEAPQVDLSGLGQLAAAGLYQGKDTGEVEETVESTIQRGGTVPGTPFDFYQQLGIIPGQEELARISRRAI